MWAPISIGRIFVLHTEDPGSSPGGSTLLVSFTDLDTLLSGRSLLYAFRSSIR